jgi:hypothetical protein
MLSKGLFRLACGPMVAVALGASFAWYVAPQDSGQQRSAGPSPLRPGEYRGPSLEEAVQAVGGDPLDVTEDPSAPARPGRWRPSPHGPRVIVTPPSATS